MTPERRVIFRSLEEGLILRGALGDPSVVVGGGVFPTRFKFISEGPEEVTLDDVVPSVHGTFTNLANFRVIEVGGVDRAFAFLDRRLMVTVSIRTEGFGRPVGNIDAYRSSDVRLRAVHPLAIILVYCVAVVEPSKPQGTYICSERPLSHPHIVLDILQVSVAVGVALAVVLQGGVLRGFIPAPPRLVEVSVHDDAFHVVIGEHVVPVVRVRVEGIVEYELQVRG